MDEQIWSNSIVESCQKDFVIHLVHQQGFPIETTDEGSKTLIFSLLYVQKAGWGTLMSLASDEVVDEQLT